jgi:hypothetical protein
MVTGKWQGLFMVAALGFMLWATFLLVACSPSKPDPCFQARDLKQAIEQYRRDRLAEGIERKKDALDDQFDRLQMSPEQYRRLHEEYQWLDRAAAPVIAEWEAKRQEELVHNMKLLAEAEAGCKTKER